jgi:hypothetical protein
VLGTRGNNLMMYHVDGGSGTQIGAQPADAAGGRGGRGNASGRGSIVLAGAPAGRGAAGGRGANTDEQGWSLTCPKTPRFTNDTSRVTTPSKRP